MGWEWEWEYDTPLLFCEFKGETTGDTVDIDDKELSPELWALALSVIEPDDG